MRLEDLFEMPRIDGRKSFGFSGDIQFKHKGKESHGVNIKIYNSDNDHTSIALLDNDTGKMKYNYVKLKDSEITKAEKFVVDEKDLIRNYYNGKINDDDLHNYINLNYPLHGKKIKTIK